MRRPRPSNMARAQHCACCMTCNHCRASHSQTEYRNADPVPTAASTTTSFFRCSSSFSNHTSAGVGLWAALSERQPALNRASILSTHWTGHNNRSIGSCTPEYHIRPATHLQAGHQMNEHQYHRREQQREVYIRHQSASVNMVPSASHWGSPGNYSYTAKGVYRPPGSDFNEEEAVATTTTAEATNEAEDGEERLPPHELLAREWAEATSCGGAAFSVHEGLGRTLKGRDLQRVRNAILKQTGFI